jgi:hypothetical protein
MNADNMLYHPILGLLKEVFKNDTGGAFRTFRKQGRVIIQKQPDHNTIQQVTNNDCRMYGVIPTLFQDYKNHFKTS